MSLNFEKQQGEDVQSLTTKLEQHYQAVLERILESQGKFSLTFPHESIPDQAFVQDDKEVHYVFITHAFTVPKLEHVEYGIQKLIDSIVSRTDSIETVIFRKKLTIETYETSPDCYVSLRLARIPKNKLESVRDCLSKW